MPPPLASSTKPGSSLSIWAFTIALALAAAIAWIGDSRTLQPIVAPIHLAWPLLACGFALGHFASINVEFRGSSHQLDLTDVIILPAIIFAGPLPVILAAAVGTAARSLYGRRALIKAAFNVALHAMAAALAVDVFYLVLGSANVLSARGWAASGAAVLVAVVVSQVCIHAVIALSAGRLPVNGLSQVGVTLPLVFAIDFTLGLTAIHMLWASLGGGFLFIAIAVAVAFAYRAHGRLQLRHRTLTQLYHFEQALAGIVESDLVIAAVLNEALLLFNAEVAQLVVPGEFLSSCHTLRAGQTTPEVSLARHPLVDLLDSESKVLLAPTGTSEERMVAALDRCGFRDALMLRLPTDVAGTLEVLVIADRLGGDHPTFDATDGHFAEALATPAAMALRSSDLLNQLRTEVATKEYQATHDALTGLANRTLFSASVDWALELRPPHAFVGVMIIDLDGFKSLNDSFGHEAGDAMLQHVASCVSALVDNAGTVGRLGGDEFAVVVSNELGTDEIVSLARSIYSAIKVPVTIAGSSVHVRASIGVAVAPEHGEDRTTLLRQADFAMYRAKQRGGGVAHHNDYQDGKLDRPSMILALREAIDTSSLTLNYQPKLRLSDSRVVGVEALLRWTHPIYGVITPDEFIPVAEGAGMIAPLTRWVLDHAMTQCYEWHRDGLDLNVAVNLSPSQINDEEIIEQVIQLLHYYDLPPHALSLEITESSDILDKASDDIEMLETLSNLGVRISIDDFGVGTSSLTRIRNFPVQELKIDKSFILNLDSDPRDYAVVASTVELAHDLGLEVVAEGVESPLVAEKLRSLNCDIVQGYLYSMPMPAQDLAVWVRSRGPILPEQSSTIIPFPLPSAAASRPTEGQHALVSEH